MSYKKFSQSASRIVILMNVRGIREGDFVFMIDKEILFVVPNSIKIRGEMAS
jgi:hypothetical protein